MKRRIKALPLLVLGAMGLCVTAGPVLAGPREDVLSALQHCASIPDDQAWLNCYFGSAQPMETHLGQAAAAAAPVYSAPAYGVGAAPAPAYGVGAVRPAAPQPYGVGAMAAVSGPPPMPHYQGGLYSGVFGTGKLTVSNLRMKSYDFDGRGRFIVTLADDEVWQQLPDDSARAHWHDAANKYVVSVGQGALGTYNLSVNGEGDSFKAHRIK